MDFSVPLNQLTERARTVDEPAWVDAVRWLKKPAHLLKNQIFPDDGSSLPPDVQHAFDAAAPRMQRLAEAQRLSVAGGLREAFQRASAFEQTNAFESNLAATTGHALALAGAVMARTSGLTPYATQYRAQNRLVLGLPSPKKCDFKVTRRQEQI